MQLAEHAERDLWPKFECSGAPWMKPGRRLPRHGKVALVDAEARKRRHRVGLGGKHIRSGSLAGPVAARAGKRRMAKAHAGGGGDLILWKGPAIGLAKLEQRAVSKAAIAISLRGSDEAWQKSRPHLGELGRDRIAESEFRRAAAEKLRLIRRHERPGHRLDQSARSKHTPHAPRPELHLGQHRTRHAG